MTSDENLLTPISIGTVQVDIPCALAALAGFSDQPMRRICREMGAGYAIGEVLLDQLVIAVGRRKQRRYLGVSDDEHPLAGQIMGNTAEDLATAAVRIVDSGFDVVDINMGCPVRKVIGRQRGGWILSDPTIALEMISRVRDAVPDAVPVTLKMRRGMDDTAESEDKFWIILNGAIERGVAAVTVHGRTVQQKYNGPSDWNFLTKVKRSVGSQLKIFGSGDLFEAEDVLRMLRETGVDGVTIARGAIGNPWIFRETTALLHGQPKPAPPTLGEQRDFFERLFAYSVEIYGEKRAPSEVGRHFLRTAMRHHPQPNAVRDALVNAGSRQWKTVLEQWYPRTES